MMFKYGLALKRILIIIMGAKPVEFSKTQLIYRRRRPGGKEKNEGTLIL